MSFVADFSPQIAPAAHHWVVAVAGGKLLAPLAADTLLQLHQDLAHFSPALNYHHYLGLWHGVPCFVSVYHERDLPESNTWALRGLRAFLGVLDDPEFMVVARALQLAHWQEFHRFCGRCGAPTQAQSSERVLHCHQCDARFYPRIAPCVIGLVFKGDQCLLAHNASFSRGRYSILAGFVEPGETAEQALQREVREEVGIEIEQVRYCSSQPWPFPSQLMLGFTARHRAGEICVDGHEIVHADWFDAHNLPDIPPPESLSGRLIRNFFEQVQRGKLDVL